MEASGASIRLSLLLPDFSEQFLAPILYFQRYFSGVQNLKLYRYNAMLLIWIEARSIAAIAFNKESCVVHVCHILPRTYFYEKDELSLAYMIVSAF